MIKVTCNRGEMSMEFNGNGITIMSELCCIVDSVCESFTEDEDDSTEFKNIMITEVAHALLAKVRKSEKDNK